MTIDCSLIKPDPSNPVDGLYLNPRTTYGWNDELATVLKHRALSNTMDVATMIREYVDDENVDQYLAKVTSAKAAYQLFSSVIPSYGYGYTVEQAIKRATQRFNKQFKHLMPGQFSNATAYKWTYLNPEYTNCLHLSDPKLCIDEYIIFKEE